ncbi:hypothetical protein PAERUG_P1_London_28_IMP_1_04_05_01265 [Pseudomonas aeruginosa]|nr:hypothetical protein PAERUG_P1_London_28_IMP_1_04_05_01265 [Pseudomonas aeruginosa]CRP52314.1 hypothetical protein PAERUG_P18_London_17_VIM_2_04_10_03678 [Pseudomonas aeruginosa]VTQ44189.1 Uncharacterised protein [Pseudomonas aeruginosa]
MAAMIPTIGSRMIRLARTFTPVLFAGGGGP